MCELGSIDAVSARARLAALRRSRNGMSSVLNRRPDSFPPPVGDGVARPLSTPPLRPRSSWGVVGVRGVPGAACCAAGWRVVGSSCRAGALAACSTSATTWRGSSRGTPNSVRITFAVAVPLGNLRASPRLKSWPT